MLTNPDGFAGLCNGHFLTKGHNACKTWDASADGYCRADGVGSIVIKRLEDAGEFYTRSCMYICILDFNLSFMMG